MWYFSFEYPRQSNRIVQARTHIRRRTESWFAQVDKTSNVAPRVASTVLLQLIAGVEGNEIGNNSEAFIWCVMARYPCRILKTGCRVYIAYVGSWSRSER